MKQDWIKAVKKNIYEERKLFIFCLVLIIWFELLASFARADDNDNNRMKTLEGSESRWSGQFLLGYLGPSISKPLASESPNPGNMVPAPLVTMSGTVAARYRFDESTTLGMGSGIMTETPFQRPKNTSVSDPYMDVAYSYSFMEIRNRFDVQATFWSNKQYHDDTGYRFGLTILNDSYFKVVSSFSMGLVLSMDFNLFDTSRDYDLSQQTQYDIYVDPYFEYILSKKINLRSVIGMVLRHTRNISDPFTFDFPAPYQTLGMGVAVASSFFIYPYIQFFPFSGKVSDSTTLFGLSAIINLL